MKLIKFQLGGKNLPLTDVQKFQLNQVNPLTGKKPEIRGWEINNGELDVVTAESGTKLESKEATPLMNFFKFLIPGFKQAYDQKLAQRNYDAKMKAQYKVRIPLQETPESIYKPKVQLAKKPQTAAPVAQNKPITKHQFGTTKRGIQSRGSNKSNRFVAQFVNSIPEVNVNGIDRRWHLDKRNMDLGNGRGISSEVFYDYYDGGNSYLGDFAKVRGGRTIYSSPKGNDTIYFNTPTMEDGWYKHVGNMVVGSPQPGAKANFFKNLKRPLIKRQEGGPIERADNTRVLQHTPNNGEVIYERTPVGYGDFLPLVGTYRAAQRIDNREPNASYKDLIVNGAMDLLGAGMVGSVVKAAGKANRIAKALKSKGFVPGSKEGIYIKQGATGPINRVSGNVKQIPTVDYYNVAMQPMIQSLRVPAIAIGK